MGATRRALRSQFRRAETRSPDPREPDGGDPAGALLPRRVWRGIHVVHGGLAGHGPGPDFGNHRTFWRRGDSAAETAHAHMPAAVMVFVIAAIFPRESCP